MRAVALLISLSMTLGACFPTNPKAQKYAKLTEGALLVGGIAMLFFANTGADCDAMGRPGEPDTNCHTKATVLGDVGLALVLAGLIGFIATVSTSEEDKKTEPTAAPIPAPPPTTTPPAPAPPAAEPPPAPPAATPPPGA